MTASAVVALLTALFKTIPYLKQVWDDILREYVKSQKQKIIDENNESVDIAISTQDQRPIEIALGAEVAGKPSGHSDTEIVTSLPGVIK
jgi:hypothetical protein